MVAIYIFTNKINGKQYVGQTTRFTRRMREHELCQTDMIIHKAIRKYGWNNFKLEYLEVDKSMRNVYESTMIDRLNTKVPNGYNLTDGGNGVCGLPAWNKGKTGIYTEETRRRISESQIGRIPWNKGKKMSDESCKKMSEHWKDKRMGKDHPRARALIVIHPDNTEERFDCVVGACKEYSLDKANLYRVLKGEYKQHKGFKFRYAGGV